MTAFDVAHIDRAVDESLAALKVCQASTSLWLKDFPRNSCDLASFVIGHVLLDRDLGDWTYVNGAASPEVIPRSWLGPAGHTWLELRSGPATLFFIDVTVRQFKLFEFAPLSGVGHNSAAGTFVNERKEDPVSRIPIWRTYPVYHAALAEVRATLLAR
ncbi:hypothetical protein AB4Z38_08875 [Arthrobacter sp. 2RAF6]|uniref:hypothetical protein n=1 Tax=Arthrobacter sp. 2RAF6 TaxID=3233002 RepID=UPI003F8EBE70